MMRAYLWRYLLFVLFMPTLAYAQPPVVADGEIRGTVKLRGGEVGIPNVTVRLIGTERQTLTDTNGKFRFDKLQPGAYTLTATAAGARPVSGVVTVKSEELAEVKLEIKHEVFTLEEIEVLGQQMQPRGGKQTLRAKEIKRVPGTVGDVLRALQVLPGIGVGNDWDSILYIRGGPPGDNRFYFDYTPWTFLSATLGLRLDYFNLTKTVSVQPRGRLQFKIRNGGVAFLTISLLSVKQQRSYPNEV